MSERLLTGEQWSNFLKIEILEPKGWDSQESYGSSFITKTEYCNRAANSVLKTKVAATRREANKLRGEHKNKNL